MNSQQAYISVLLVFAVIVGGGASTALASAGGTASAVPEPRVQPQVSNGSVSNVTPALEFTSQTSYGASVVLDEANLSAGGFVAVHRGEGTSGPIVGISRRLDRGAHQDVRVVVRRTRTELRPHGLGPHAEPDGGALPRYDQ